MTDLLRRLSDLAESLEGCEWHHPPLSVETCREAKAIIGKLPVTKDGVRWYPGMELWPPIRDRHTPEGEAITIFDPSRDVSVEYDESEGVSIVARFDCAPSWDGGCDYGEECIAVSDCYSTEQAARGVAK